MNRNSLPTAYRQRSQDDSGIALIVAIALMAIVGVLLVVMVSVAIHENNASGRDRQRSSGVMAAEGQVDTLISKIQSAPPATLPCSPSSTPNVNVTVGSDRMVIKYRHLLRRGWQCAGMPGLRDGRGGQGEYQVHLEIQCHRWSGGRRANCRDVAHPHAHL